MNYRTFLWRPRNYGSSDKRERSERRVLSKQEPTTEEKNDFYRPFIPPERKTIEAPDLNDGFMVKKNKREEITNNLAMRDLSIQTCINPFLNSNYLEDLDIHDKYLKPKNTTM